MFSSSYPDLQNDTVNFFERFSQSFAARFAFASLAAYPGILHSFFSFPQSPEGRPRVRDYLPNPVSP